MEDARHTPASAVEAHAAHDHPEHPGAVNQTNDDHTRQPANLSSAPEARRPSSGPQTLQANSKFTSMYKRRRSRLVITDPAQIFPITPADFNEIIERKDLAKIIELGGPNGVMHALRTNEVDGITTDEVEVAARIERYTRNELPAADPVSFWKLFFTALKDKTMIMLIVAAVVSIILGMTLADPHTGRVEREIGWIEGVAILFSVTLVVLVSSVSDYQKAKKFEELDKETAKRSVMCIRNGHREQIDGSELLVGDLIEFEYGQQLAVDALYLRGSEVKCDESAATGESDYIKKNTDKDPFLISGTNVVEGSGKAVVVGVGIHSFNGKLTMATRGGGNAETPLQIKLGKMADYIGRGGAIAAVLVLVALIIRNAIVVATNGREYNVNALVGYIIVSITVVVVAVPEGLPLAVTIALAYSMKAMLTDNCLVRVLRSCETMGGCTSICSDKTGTLTTNEMTVVQGWVAEEQFVIAGYGIEPLEGMSNPLSTSARNLKDAALPQKPQSVEPETKAGQPRGKIQLKTTSNLMEIICKSMSINSTADERPNNEGKMIWVGNKTEQGLLGFVKRFCDYKEFRKAVADENRHAYPFSSTKKRMVTIVHNDGNYTVHIKGASEIVLADSTHYLSPSGERKPMTADKRAQIEKAIMYMADQGNRTIAVATAESKGPLPNSELRPGGMAFPEEEPNDVKELCLVAIMGIQDPIRSEVPNAVQLCQKAGITVRMVTGDNINTAKAIAKKCGIYNEDKGIALEGREFRQIAKEDPARLNEILPRLQVVARSSPTDKHILVKALMELGEIVAVTGDGTNDAPALTTADVGFAMRTGTEVAKGAADMVLMDDNFASVVGATRWGRTVNDNVRKFLQFQLTINVVGVLLTFIGSAMSDEGESPLKPVQLLWLNLVMDTLAALCLATEMPTWESLERPPRLRSAPLISRSMWTFIIGHSIFQLTVVIVLMVCGHVWFEVGTCLSEDAPHYDASGKNCKMGKVHCTVIFNSFILMQLVNQWNARKLYGELNPFTGLARNKLMVYLFPVTLGIQVFAVECEPVMREAMKTYPLNWNQWVGCCVIALVELPVGLLVKLVTRYVPEWKPKPTEQEGNADVIRVRVEGSDQNTAAGEARS